MRSSRLMASAAVVALALACHASSYDILDYGAVADTATLSTKAIQAAIDDCHSHGGGVVVVPAGDYKVASIELKPHICLSLEAGATIYASRDTADYRRVALGGKDVPSQEVVLWAVDADDISVTGPGRIHCQAVREQYRRGEKKPGGTDYVTGREIDNAIMYGVDYRTKYRKVPPCPTAINLVGCSNVRLSGFSVIESSSWGIHLQWCDLVFANGLHVTSSSDNGVNSDGIDVDGCSRVMISDCVIDTGDDGICLKTTRIDGVSKPCRDIAVANCVLTSSSAAFKLGTESHSDFENITVSNCVISNANRGLNMIIRDCGNVRNVLFSDIVIDTRRKATFWWGNGDPVWLTTQKRGDAECSGYIENVVFRNIIAHGQSGVRVENFDSRITNIVFNGFQLYMEPEDAADKRARDAFLFYGVDDLRLIDCDVNWNQASPEPAWESAFNLIGCTDVTMRDCRYPAAPGSSFPPIRTASTTPFTPR